MVSVVTQMILVVDGVWGVVSVVARVILVVD